MQEDARYLHVRLFSFGICVGTFISAFLSVGFSQLAPLLQLKNHLTSEQLVHQLSITTSAFNLGSIIGPLFSPPLVQRLGYRRSLLLIDFCCAILFFAQLYELRYQFLGLCRLVLGFFVGMSMSIIPVYLKELSPMEISGQVGSYNQVMQVVGVLFCYCWGLWLDDSNGQDWWRWRLYLGVLVGIVGVRLVVLGWVYPYDSPTKELERGRVDKVKEYYSLIYQDAEQMVDNLKSNTKSSPAQKADNSGVRVSTWSRRLVVALVVISINQLTGINGIMYYSKQLFNKITHNSASYTQMLMIVLACLQIASAGNSGRYIDRWGRKTIILTGLWMLIMVLFVIWLIKLPVVEVWLGGGVDVLCVGLIFLHVVIHNMTLSPCCVIYCAEVFEDFSYIMITLKICSMSVALSAEYMIEFLGFGYMFGIFGVASLFCYFFLRNRLVETAGRSSEAIYASFPHQKIHSS